MAENNEKKLTFKEEVIDFLKFAVTFLTVFFKERTSN